jgi:hypothetical protein
MMGNIWPGISTAGRRVALPSPFLRRGLVLGTLVDTTGYSPLRIPHAMSVPAFLDSMSNKNLPPPLPSSPREHFANLGVTYTRITIDTTYLFITSFTLIARSSAVGRVEMFEIFLGEAKFIFCKRQTDNPFEDMLVSR